VKKLARLSGWTVGYVAANQVAFFVVLVLAYRTKADVSIYLAAFTFFQLPHGLLAVSVMTALAPEFATRHQANDIDGLRANFTTGLRMLVLTMIPAGVGMALLSRPLIRALLDHGDFHASSVAPTADALRAFAVGLIVFSVYLYVVRTFSSMQDTRTPFLLNLVENGVNVATAFTLYAWLGVEGLAWSWTIAYGVGAIVSLLALRARLVRIDGRALLTTTTKVVAALVPSGVAVVVIARVVGDASFGAAVAVLVAAAIVGSALFAGALQVLGIPLIRMILDILRRDRTTAAANA
jgi:putative peptidoglycan lipid II flippase